jgi:ubiquinone/menaquinone biosynthesis C-methylase UbiE
VAAALPDLPFADGSFAVALCSHLLFCYPQLGRGFHQAALEELTRVAREVRVFPLLPGARGGGQEATPGWFREVLDGAGRHRVGTTRYRYWDHQREYLVLGVGA